MEPAPEQPEAAKKPAPVMDIVTPPPVEKPADGEAAEQPPQTAEEHLAPKESVHPKPPKQPGNGITTAIIATVVIVVILAALATYAFIKTAK